MVKHARYYWLLLAEGHLSRRLFGDMLDRLRALPPPSGSRCGGEDQQFVALETFRTEQCQPERGSTRSINVCEPMDKPWRLPGEVMGRVQREKTSYSGQRTCIL